MFEFFRAVEEDERRYIDGTTQNPDLAGLKQGTVLKAQGGPFDNRLSSYVLATAGDQSLTMKKSDFLSQPLDRRTGDSNEGESSVYDKHHEILEISERICRKRAEQIVAAVIAAMNSEGNYLPQNPFRESDTLDEAVIAVKGADLMLHQIPHTVEDDAPGHTVYRDKIISAVRRLMRLKQ